MENPAARLTLLTICVADIARSAAFYEALGFRRKAHKAEGVAFFDAGGVILSLWSASEMAKDAGIAVEAKSGFRDVSLAWNVASPEEVDRAVARASAAGARTLKKPTTVFWGGYTAYFADPDDHIWEVAYNPTFPLSDDGRLMLPD
ncbi:MAG: VOC family protein [Rhizobiales bacterium]|nr:VOC family protein [Hyphomicrobiales bacterium]